MSSAKNKSFLLYEEGNMKAAIEAVRGGMSKKAAATTYNVPR